MLLQPKCAVCCVAKNEVHEILYWIAWQFAIGFDTVILFDDDSSDGTVKLVEASLGDFDIRLYKVERSATYHAVRQVQIYNFVADNFKHHFDWIAFFDADEYLDLYGEQLGSFVNKFGNFDSIAFNWCNFGSSGHIKRPEGAPVTEYTRHGSRELFWNKHTKVITRPLAIPSGKITYVHSSPVAPEKTAAPDGFPIKWAANHAGLTADVPSWEGGRLLHYQSRSMENYVAREYLREDLRRNKDDPSNIVFTNQEYNEISSEVHHSYVQKMNSILHGMSKNILVTIGKIERNVFKTDEIKNFSWNRTSYLSIFSEKKSFGDFEKSQNWTSSHRLPVPIYSAGSDAFELYEVIDSEGRRLQVSNGEVITGDDLGQNNVFAICLINTPYIFFTHKTTLPLYVKEDPRILSVLTYETFINENGSFSFVHPRTRRYVSALRNSNLVVADRIRAQEWEQFTLQKAEPDEQILNIATRISRFNDTSFLDSMANNKGPADDVPAAILSMLPEARLALIKHLIGDIPKIIF